MGYLPAPTVWLKLCKLNDFHVFFLLLMVLMVILSCLTIIDVCFNNPVSVFKYQFL